MRRGVCSVCDKGAHTFGVQPEGKSPLVRHTHRWEYNIRINLPEIGRGISWTDLAQKANCRVL